MVRVATWADLGAPELDGKPLEKHYGDGHKHPYYIRTDREKARLVAKAATLGQPIRMAPDVCGTLIGDSRHKFGVPSRCDPSLPFGTLAAEAVA